MADSTTTRQDLLQMFVNVSDAFPAFFTLMQVLFALIGLLLLGQALFDVYSLNNEHVARRAGRSISASGVGWRFVTSIVLTGIVWWVDVTENTLMGRDASSGAMLYQTVGMSEFQQAALMSIMMTFELVGYIAFGRGWLLLDKHFNGGNNGVASPIWHMLGGTVLVYLDVWLPAFGRWTGFDFVNILLF